MFPGFCFSILCVSRMWESRAQVHNKTLSVNLAQHAAVLEKLIALNAELMDQLNARTTQKLHLPPPPSAPEVWVSLSPTGLREWARTIERHGTRCSCVGLPPGIHRNYLETSSRREMGSNCGMLAVFLLFYSYGAHTVQTDLIATSQDSPALDEMMGCVQPYGAAIC